MRNVTKIILLLTILAVVLAGVTIITVYIHIGEDFGNTTVIPVKEPVNNVNDVVLKHEEVVLMYDETEHEILSIIIYQEAGGNECSDDTRFKVGSVFLNRVASPLFPDTFEEVATGHKQYGTLYKTGIKWPDRASKEQEEYAIQRAKDIAEDLLIGGPILPPDVIWQAEFTQGDGVYCYQDGMYFCY